MRASGTPVRCASKKSGEDAEWDRVLAVLENAGRIADPAQSIYRRKNLLPSHKESGGPAGKYTPPANRLNSYA
jgi:hypothetical protein